MIVFQKLEFLRSDTIVVHFKSATATERLMKKWKKKDKSKRDGTTTHPPFTAFMSWPAILKSAF